MQIVISALAFVFFLLGAYLWYEHGVNIDFCLSHVTVAVLCAVSACSIVLRQFGRGTALFRAVEETLVTLWYAAGLFSVYMLSIFAPWKGEVGFVSLYGIVFVLCLGLLGTVLRMAHFICTSSRGRMVYVFMAFAVIHGLSGIVKRVLELLF